MKHVNKLRGKIQGSKYYDKWNIKFKVYCEDRMKHVNKLRGKIQGSKYYDKWNIKLPLGHKWTTFSR